MKKIDLALNYALQGVAIFPVEAEDNRTPLTPRGILDATADAATIRRWWTDHPDANVAIPKKAGGFSVVGLLRVKTPQVSPAPKTEHQAHPAKVAKTDDIAQGAPSVPAVTFTLEEMLEEDETVRFKDSGNAAYFAVKCGKGLRYVVERGHWYVWDGKRWAEDVSGAAVQSLAEAAMRTRLVELAAEEKVDSDKIKMAASATERYKLDSAIDLARGRLAISDGGFDKDPYLLNVLNGTVDLRTGELRPHDPNDLLTMLAPVAYDGRATCPRFLKFLAEVLPEIPLGTLQRWFGYAATGDDRERKFQVWRGEGRNGKTTLKNAIMAVMGEYATEVSISVFTGKNRDYKGDDLVGLRSKRMVFASEPEDGVILNAALLKKVVGNDNIRCRPLKSNAWIEYRPPFHIMLLTNYEIGVYDSGNAIWDRLDLVMFNRRFEKAEEDKGLREKLRAEAPGILAWIVQGAVAWHCEGFDENTRIADYTNAYRQRQDVFGQFLQWYNDPSTPGYGGFPLPSSRWPVGSEFLHSVYKVWTEREGAGQALGSRRFAEEMERHGYSRSAHGEHGRTWTKTADGMTGPDGISTIPAMKISYEGMVKHPSAPVSRQPDNDEEPVSTRQHPSKVTLDDLAAARRKKEVSS